MFLALTCLLTMQLVGYYAAANVVDYRWLGRRRLTVFSFIMVALIFAAVAGAYPELIDTKHRKNIHVFQFLYYISSFFGLFGSHTTSFLLSAEVSAYHWIACACVVPYLLVVECIVHCMYQYCDGTQALRFNPL